MSRASAPNVRRRRGAPRSRALAAAAVGLALLPGLAGCASAPPDEGPPRPPSFRFAAADEGLVRDEIDAQARREDFLLPKDDDPARPEPVYTDRLVYRKRIERRDFPFYKSLWANQVPFDPEWKVEFVFRPDGDSTSVTGYAYIRTREPPDGEWDEHPVDEGHVSESVRRIVAETERLLPETPRRR